MQKITWKLFCIGAVIGMMNILPINAFAKTENHLPQPILPETQTISHAETMEHLNAAFDEMQITGDAKFDTHASVDNFQMLNYQYEEMEKHMQSMGFGTKNELKKPDTNPGYTQSMQELFYSKYGNIIKDNQLKIPELPEEFNVQRMLDDAQNARDTVLRDFRNSPQYKSTVNAISIGAVFKTASETKTLPALLSKDELQDALSPLSQGAQLQQAQDMQSYTDLNALLKQYQDAANPNQVGNTAALNQAAAKTAFDEYQKEIKAWLDLNTQAASERLEEVQK